MIIYSLGALKMSSEKKERRIKKEIVEVLQQACHLRRDGDDEILGFDLVFVG